MKTGRNVKIFAAGLAIFLLTIGAGVYAQELGKAENLGFQVAVPAGIITAPTVVKGPSSQVAMAPLTINLIQRGLPKVMFNGGIERIETHRITNVGNKPIRIRMEMVNATMPVRAEVKANFGYDPDTDTFTEPLMPGKSIPNLGMDWFFEFPTDNVYAPVVYDGGLKFTDADTGELLTFLPIRVINSDQSGTSSDPTAGACH